jgi:hypothetical protein
LEIERVYHVFWPLVLFSDVSGGQVDLEAYEIGAKYLGSVQFIDTRIFSSCPALEPASLAFTAVRITAIIISIIFFVIATSRITAVITLKRLWLGPMQPLLRMINHILDSCNIDTNLEFPVSGVLARRRFDEVRNVECLSFSMAQTYEFVIAAVKD